MITVIIFVVSVILGWVIANLILDVSNTEEDSK